MSSNRTFIVPNGASLSRRTALRSAALGAASLAAIATTPADAGVADTDMLNYLLNLEYLEAEFFYYAAYGQGIPAADRTGAGVQGAVSPGARAKLSTAVRDYATTLAADEIAHVRYLRALIGGSLVIAEPTIDIGIGPNSAFSEFAIAAGLIVPGQTFNPYADDTSFLLGASIFEDVVVTAYAGVAALLVRPFLRQTATNFAATEGYHAGAIRTYLANLGAGQSFNLISNLRGTLSAGSNNTADEQGILIQGNSHNFVPDAPNGGVYARSTTQVLNIVYGNTSAQPGLFYPNGFNGNIR